MTNTGNRNRATQCSHVVYSEETFSFGGFFHLDVLLSFEYTFSFVDTYFCLGILLDTFDLEIIDDWIWVVSFAGGSWYET